MSPLTQLSSDNHLSQSTRFSYKNQTLPFSLFNLNHQSTISNSNMLPVKQYIAGNGTTGTGKPPMKKSSVAQTCNQLSLFLKEKGCLRDLRLGINAKFDDTVKSPAERATLDLLSNMNNPDQNTAQTEKPPVSQKPEDSVNKATSGRSVASTESKTAPMTIFYNGQVMVFDEIPADRARDVMLAAGSYVSSSGGTDTFNHPSGMRESNQPIQVRLQANGLDLPIARRASLHKFLAKRKDRTTMRAPYQVHNPSPAAGSSNNGHKFDLNL